MANEIQNFEGGREIAAYSSNDILAMVVAAAKDPTVDADKMRAMATLAMDMQKHQLEMDKISRQEQFNRDLNMAIDEMPVLTKTGRIIIPAKGGEPERIQGTYVKFEDLNRIVKPILQRHNLTISFTPGGSDSRVSVATVIRHANGIVKEYEALPLPLETSGSKNNVQGVGSSISYGKRYAMCAVLNITIEAEDDDGAGGKITMPEERGNLIIEEAQAAVDDGQYAEWFRRQSPKDRGWLVTSGYHAQFGGTAAITDQRTPAATAPPTPATDSPPKAEKPSEEVAAAAWVKKYIAKVETAASLDAFAEIQTEAKDRLDRIRAAYPALWNDISFAHGAAYDRLSGNQDDSKSAAGDLFEGSDE